MKLSDITPRLKNELDQWFIRQCQNPFDRFYLYYQEGTPEHNGGFIIAKNQPSNGSYRLASMEHINRGKTVEQNFYTLLPIVNRLPILDVEVIA